MNFRFLTQDFRISPRKLAAVTLLTSGTLAWFFLLIAYIAEILQSLTPHDSFLAYISTILFCSFTVFWGLVGSLIGGKIDRRKFLFSWILLGVFATISLSLFQGTIFSIISSSLLGLSLGLGLPSSLSFIADCTVVEERARVSGIIILLTFIMAIFAIVATRILGLGLLGVILLSAAIRSASLLALVLDKCVEKKEEKKPLLPGTAYKDFLFYLLPWVMFNIASGLALNLIPQTSDYTMYVSIGTALRYVCIAIFGLVAGVVADRFGRKQPIIIGLIMLGASFALLGFNMSPQSALIYLTASGVAWGSFFVVFLAVPGDLSIPSSREKFYAIMTFLPLVIILSWSTIPSAAFLANFPAGPVSQVLSLILFLSIIPILRAKETLPESSMRVRKMKEYVNKVGKLVQESKKD